MVVFLFFYLRLRMSTGKCPASTVWQHNGYLVFSFFMRNTWTSTNVRWGHAFNNTYKIHDRVEETKLLLTIMTTGMDTMIAAVPISAVPVPAVLSIMDRKMGTCIQ